jgi:hypothetical protein
MKRIWVIASFLAVAVSGPAHALHHYITKRPISDLQCNVSLGRPTYSFVAHWGALVDATSRANPRPLLMDSRTGKAWPTYKVALISVGDRCKLPNGSEAQVVNCGGATECSIVVTCPLRATGTTVHVVGEGIASTSVPMPGGRKPAGCN